MTIINNLVFYILKYFSIAVIISGFLLAAYIDHIDFKYCQQQTKVKRDECLSAFNLD